MELGIKYLYAVFITLFLSMVAINQANAEPDKTDLKQAKLEQSESNKYQGQDWSLFNLNGDKVTLSAYQGKPVILVFWATWCPYCKKLLPGIESLHQKYEDLGLKVIGVNIREDWQPKTYWGNHGYTFDTVLDGDDIADIYGISGTPGIVFIDPNGRVLKATNFSDPNHPSLELFSQHYLTEK